MVRYTHRFEVLQLHQLEWLLLDNLLVGIERHYGDPRFLIVEIIFSIDSNNQPSLFTFL